MRRPTALCATLLTAVSLALAAPAAPASVEANDSQSAVHLTGSRPVGSFTINHGQWPDSILFQAIAQSATIWFARDGLYFQVPMPAPDANIPDLGPWPNPNVFNVSPDSISYCRIVPVRFTGANTDVQVEGAYRGKHLSNYFLGNDPTQWHTNVPSYASVIYKNLYDGIDYVFYFKDGLLEYDIVAQPGSDISDIRLSLEDADVVDVDDDGALMALVGPNTIRQHIPRVIQRSVAGERTLTGLWQLRRPGEFGVAVTDEVNPMLALVIDPVVTFSTYWGGSGIEEVRDLAVNASGDIAITGTTNSADFPVQSEIQSAIIGSYDAFVTKFSGADNSLVFSTYIGGTAGGLFPTEPGEGVAIDGPGDVYVAGYTRSTDFPTVNAIQPTAQGLYDCYVFKLDRDGDSLIYSTYYGGLGQDQADDIAVDNLGAVYVVGKTGSSDFPLQNPVRDSLLSTDAMAFKLSPDGDSIIFSTYLGGSVEELVDRVAIDNDYNVYIFGSTNSPDLPITPGVMGTTFPGSFTDFLCKLPPTGDSLLISTYAFDDRADMNDIAVDANGNIYMAGTGQDGLPTPNGYQQTLAGGFIDWYAVKIDPGYSNVISATYLGDVTSDEVAFDIEVDSDGRVFLAGKATFFFPEVFPSPQSYVAAKQGAPKYKMTLALLSPDFSCTMFSTFIGSNVTTTDFPILADLVSPGEFVVGGTYSYSDFPLIDPLQTLTGGRSAVVARISHPVCEITRTGDVNNDCTITSADIIALVNYVFKGGAEPVPCPAAGDVNCDGVVTSADIIYLVNFVFKGGPWPCNVCELFPSIWNCN